MKLIIILLFFFSFFLSQRNYDSDFCLFFFDHSITFLRKRVSFPSKNLDYSLLQSPSLPTPSPFSLFYLQKQSQWSGAQCNFTKQRTMRRINGSYKMDESTRRTAGEDSKQQWGFREWNYWSWGGRKKKKKKRKEKNKFHEWRSTGRERVIRCRNK